MNRSEITTMAMRMLREARALRAAFPDEDAMRGLPVSDRPPESADDAAPGLRAALVYLRDEMLLVRAGKARALTVLDDEIACVEGLLPPT